MHIVYAAHIGSLAESGILKKIATQALAWQAFGHSVSLVLFLAHTGGPSWKGLQDLHIVNVDDGGHRWASRLTAVWAWTDVIRAEKPDVVYLRLDNAYPGIVRLARDIPVVGELNSNFEEYLSTRGRVRAVAQQVSDLFLERQLKGLVVPCAGQRPCNLLVRRVPTCVVGNSVHLEDFDPIPLPEHQGTTLGFIASSGFPWSGLDHIMQLAEKRPTWEFDVVGPAPSDVGAHCPPNVHVYGYLAQAEYLQLAKSWNVAIGGLALYRKGLRDGSLLKVREYLALGLPVINAYWDDDVAALPCVLTLPAGPHCIVDNMPCIDAFVAEWGQRRVPHEWLQSIDAHYLEAKRLAFMTQVLHSS